MFSEFLSKSINSAIMFENFPSSDLADFTSFHKKGRKKKKEIKRSFRKRYSTQYCPLVMLEMWKMSVHKGPVFVNCRLFKGI